MVADIKEHHMHEGRSLHAGALMDDMRSSPLFSGD